MGLLEGHRVLVTGAGSGIGRATCHRLHEEGATVAALDLDRDSAARVAEEVDGPAVVADMADRSAVDAAVERAVEALGGLSLMVNNAGIGLARPFHRHSDRAYDLVVDASMRGTFHGIRATAPVILAGGGGAIVNVSSISGMRPTRGEAAYSAAKAAVIALTRSAALEYGPTVRVNCVSPGLIDTPFTAPFLDDPAIRSGIERRTPLGRGVLHHRGQRSGGRREPAAQLPGGGAPHRTGRVSGPGATGEGRLRWRPRGRRPAADGRPVR
jgi:NAD(P)-dependent dehydrogenase (short-subunit alcohol dehydrogenase family)